MWQIQKNGMLLSIKRDGIVPWQQQGYLEIITLGDSARQRRADMMWLIVRSK